MIYAVDMYYVCIRCASMYVYIGICIFVSRYLAWLEGCGLQPVRMTCEMDGVARTAQEAWSRAVFKPSVISFNWFLRWIAIISSIMGNCATATNRQCNPLFNPSTRIWVTKITAWLAFPFTVSDVFSLKHPRVAQDAVWEVGVQQEFNRSSKDCDGFSTAKVALHCMTWHYMTLHDITWHYMTLHDITWHYITLHYWCSKLSVILVCWLVDVDSKNYGLW